MFVAVSILLCMLIAVILIGKSIFQNALNNPSPTVFHDIQCRIFAGGIKRWTTLPIGLLPDYTSKCYDEYAYEFKNVEFCYAGTDSSPREGCIYDIATNKSDAKLCNEIKTEWRRSECTNYINGIITR